MKIEVNPKEFRRLSSQRAREAARARVKAEPKVKHAPVKPDRGRERDPGFLAYLRRQLCEARGLGECEGPVEAAHIRYSDASKGAINPGLARKNHDRHANPLCRGHHQHDQHRGAERAFWQRVGKDAYDTAARHYAAFKGAGSSAEGTPQ